jgi:hypothetical protein
VNEPQYIDPKYRELFKDLRPEDLQLPEWLLIKLQSHRGYNYSEWSQKIREAIVACLKESVVRTDDDFVLELMLRKEREANAKADLIRVLKLISEKKAKPFDELVEVIPTHVYGSH